MEKNRFTEVYWTMRELALSFTKEKLNGLVPLNGVLSVGMEMGFADVHVTVVASCFGDGSVYLSDGHIIIGGGRFEKVRKSAFELMDRIHRKKFLMRKVDFPVLPSINEVSFFAITTTGILSYSVPLETVLNDNDSLADSFRAGQQLLYLMRQYAEKNKELKTFSM